MMERRTFLTVAAGGLLAAPLAAEAQPSELACFGSEPPEYRLSAESKVLR
jgi:hypothetical protein